jgi:hypothetical protein
MLLGAGRLEHALSPTGKVRVSDAGRSTTGSPKDSDTADLEDADTLLDELSSPP